MNFFGVFFFFFGGGGCSCESRDGTTGGVGPNLRRGGSGMQELRNVLNIKEFSE